MDTLKKAGAMLAHLELFHRMLDLRGLLQLAAHMEERGDRVTLISPASITLIGAEMHSDAQVTTAKGATIEATTAYRVLQGLKGHEAPEYAVTREELGALNARAVAELGESDALRAFEATLARITGTPTEPAGERPARGRRGAEADTPTEQPAA
ncbi:multidrug DMT transporter [Deinococcus multiflagellatus]|uniref:Multidrug DMT transporter n=1 Tax=Deinococcus multiflagellatus TaxID=1656887 RepID=A0ABW1ZNZ7_9DEIO|nr:multidrug DMT transporter [Deinococcus multiflagellatus]MBZ9713470.1 multidrug DMT transporter [Deinococcus multiflagellatus]